MGFNTSVIVLNDALGQIEQDKEFGKKITQAVNSLIWSPLGRKHIPIDISSGMQANAATVIETHHADFTTLLACGGNFVSVLGDIHSSCHHEEEDQVKLLKMLADKLGYKVVRKKRGNDKLRELREFLKPSDEK